MSEWIELESMNSQHLIVHLKDPKLLDVTIFNRLNNDDFCLSCMIQNEKKARIIYALNGLIPLDCFLEQYVFEKEEGYIFLRQLFEQAIASNRNKPVLFDPDFVFVSPYGDYFGFVVIPIQVDSWMFQKSMCQTWIEYIARKFKTTTAFEIPGFLLNFLKSDEFSLPNLVLGLDNIRRFYYPKRFTFFASKKQQVFKVKEPIQAFVYEEKEEVNKDEMEKTQLLQVVYDFKAYLVYENEKYNLCNEVNIVGRAMSCDIRFSDRSISLQHAKITCVENRYYMQDLKSTNKTFINDKEVKRKMRLKAGMKVRFGDIVCEFKE